MKLQHWMMIGLLFASVGCQAATDGGETKPTVDPDAELTGKADGISNHWTKRMGELPMNDIVFGEIDYPDYFHGYEVELTEGQTVQFTTWADAGGLVRLYGPGLHSIHGGPLHYGRAAVRSHTKRNGDRHQVDFDLTVEESGTYLLVYGPDWVWSSTYELSTKCIVGCEDTAEIKVADILADPAAYDGKRVKVTGNVFAGPAICTQLACSPANPCCNSCGASQNLHDGTDWASSDGIGLRQNGDTYRCGGNECTVAGSCTVESGRYDVVGTVVVDRFETIIDIETITPVATACEDHGDCFDGWCRQTDWGNDSPKECVAFVGEGENCSGFAPPQFINSCSPELTCVFRPFIADAPGQCRNVATVAEIMANPGMYDGMKVSIDGHFSTGPAMCTLMACTADNPCCNSCGAAQVLSDQQLSFDGLEVVDANGGTYSCGGNNCDYIDNCTTDEAGQVRVLGRIEVGQFGTVRIHTEDVMALEHF